MNVFEKLKELDKLQNNLITYYEVKLMYLKKDTIKESEKEIVNEASRKIEMNSERIDNLRVELGLKKENYNK